MRPRGAASSAPRHLHDSDGANSDGANSDGANSDGANSDGANADGANADAHGKHRRSASERTVSSDPKVSSDTTVTRQMESDLRAPNGIEAARTICLNMLAVKARTRAELSDRLTNRGVPDDVIGQILDRLVSSGLVDDHSYAAAFVSSYSRKLGLPRVELVRRLEQKGVDRQISLEATGHIDTDSERATAAALVARKLTTMSEVDEPAKTRRLIAMLARKGYSSAICYSVLRDARAELDDQISIESD